MKVNKRRMCSEKPQISLVLLHQGCWAPRRHSDDPPHDGTVCTFTLCCASSMSQQPLSWRSFRVLVTERCIAESNHYCSMDSYPSLNIYIYIYICLYIFNGYMVWFCHNSGKSKIKSVCSERGSRKREKKYLFYWGWKWLSQVIRGSCGAPPPPKFSLFSVSEQKKGFSRTGWRINEGTLTIRNPQTLFRLTRLSSKTHCF